MAARRAIWPGLALGLILLAAMPAAAQAPLPTPPQPDPLSARDARRVDRMEQVMRELRAIVFQGRDTGHPVVVQSAETEQQVSDMADRVTSLEQSLTRVNGQLETQGHDLETTRRDLQTARDANEVLSRRLTTLEQQVTTLTAPPPAPPEAAAPAAPPSAADAAAQAEAAFIAAKRLLFDGDYGAAEAAFNGYIERYATIAHGAEARYYLGKTLLARRAWPDAATAFIAAIRGWPQTTWAPDAVLSLSRSLVGMNRNTDACQTLAELNRRYPRASADVRNRATTLRTQAQCPAPAA